jgi:hypothetical protein
MPQKFLLLIIDSKNRRILANFLAKRCSPAYCTSIPDAGAGQVRLEAGLD